MKKFVVVFFALFTICWEIQGQTWPGDTIHTSINSGDPKFPFPQFLEYKVGKTLGKYNAEGVTHADMEKAMKEAYKIMMHRCLYVPGKILNGKKYIVYNHSSVPYNNNTFVSEGDGYALLAAAYFADKESFDGLWLWIHDNRLSNVKKYYDCSDLRNGYRYGGSLPGWKNTETTPVNNGDNDSATDGDYDVAMALLMACIQWGETMGINDACNRPISYKDEALKMMKGLVDTLKLNNLNGGFSGFMSGDIGIDGYCKNGNTWGELTNWRYGAANTTYPWALSKPEAYGVPGLYTDYIGPAYFHQFAEYLKTNGGTPFQIKQFKRGEASSDWLIGQMFAKGYIASSGSCSVSDNGATTTFGQHPSGPGGEDFRAAWRTILNYLWHGNPDSTWNPVTHERVPGGNTFEYDMALRHADFLKFPRTLPSPITAANCQKMGASPDLSCPLFKGVANIKQAHLVTGAEGSDNYRTNYNVGTGAPAAVASGDLDLIAEIYRQSEVLWDDSEPSMPKTASDDDRYIKSTPKYFHDWFRVLGMLTTSGNLHPPTSMVPAANMKVYMSVDKTYAYAGDLLTYTVSYRNYGSVAASGVAISTPLGPDLEFVSASNGGALTGGAITWSIGSVPGFKSATGIAPTQGKVTFVVKVKSLIAAKRACLVSTITSPGSEPWTSNEYPNNASYTMERNCVDLLAARTLSLSKTTDREAMNPGDIVNFTVNFANKSSADAWLNGGRDRVVVSYGNFYGNNSTTLYQFYRFWHSAPEAYINMNNYRISYFLNDPAAIGLYDAATNPTGWDFRVDNKNDLDKYFYNPASGPITFSYQTIPWGSDANGSWNQRIMVRFANTLTAPTTHIYDKLDNIYLIHKGVIGPGFIRTYLESKPSSILGPRLEDDWSYSKTVDIGKIDGQDKRLTPITNSWANFNSLNTPVNNYGKDICDADVPNYDRVLVEEFDGYTWRRISGKGPLPGRETYNVTVYDTIPKHLVWKGFTDSLALGKRATYASAPANASYTGIVTWQVDVMLVGDSGNLGYRVVAKDPPCPSPDINFINRAWIKSQTDSPDSAGVRLKLSCNPVPPTPPKETSLRKTANKAYAENNDVITYKVVFTNKDGSNAAWNKSATDWQVIGTNTTMPDMTNAFISLDNNKNVTDAGPNGYAFGHKKSHGKNGYTDATINTYEKGIFSLFFRYTGGTPGQTDFKGVRLEISPTNPNVINFKIYNNTTLLASYDNVAYPGIYTSIKIRAQLIDDKLYIWVNNFEGAPLKVANGIVPTAPGFAGIYSPNTEQGITSYSTHWDSAFDLSISDPLPTQLGSVSNISNQGQLTGSTITWPSIAGPIVAGDSVVRTFEAKVVSCTDFITNIATANVYGISNIQAQNVVRCGSVPACVPPTSLTAQKVTVSVCEGQPATLGAVYTLGSSTNYRYLWRKKGVAVDQAKYTANYADFSFAKVTPSDTGVYVFRINDGTDDVATCYKEIEIHLTLLPKPTAEIVTTQLTYCSGTNGVTLTATAVPNATYQWLKRGVAKGTTNPLANADSGKYAVVVALGTCADTSDEKTVSLSQQGAVSISGDTTLCTGEALILTAVPSNVTWTLPDKTTSTANPLNLTSPQAGVYKASLSNGACSGADSVMVVVENPGTPPTVSIKADKTGYCEGDTAVFTAAPINAVAPSFKWYINDLLQGDTTIVFSTLKLSPNMVVKVTVTSHGTCSGVQDATNTLSPPVRDTVGVKLSQKTVSSKVCIGQEVTFEASGTGFASGTLFDWYKDDVMVAMSATYTVPISSTTRVYATVKSTTACARPAFAYSDTIEVTAMASVEPLVVIKADRNAMCSGDRLVVFTIDTLEGSDENSEYQWLLNGNPIANETNDTLKISTLNNGEKVSLRLTSHLDCRTKDVDISNEIALSIQPSVDPTITIDTTVGGLGCEGDSVILTATHSQGTVQWSNLATGDQIVLKDWPNGYNITATLTSSEACASSPTVTSDPIVLNGTARQAFTLDWSLSPDDATPLCPGDVTISPITNTDEVTYTWTVGSDIKTGPTYTVSNVSTDLSGLVEASVEGCYVGAVDNRLVFPKSFLYNVSTPVKLTFDQTEIGTCKDKPTLVSVLSTGDIAAYEWYVQDVKVATTATDTTTLTGLKDGDILKVVALPVTSCPVDPASLSAEIPIKVSERPRNGFSNIAEPIYICSGQNVELVALETNAQYVFTWMKDGNTIPNQSTNRLNATSAGNYALVIRNGYCNETSKITIQDNGVSVKVVADPVEFVPGDAVKISAQVNPDKQVTYTWTPVQQPSDAKEFTFYPQETMFVKVQVKTVDGGCEASDSVQIRKVDKLFIPNAITPETGDQNASWDIKGTEAFPDLEVRVFNRWGSLVHEQRGYGKPWDGTFNGKPLPTGTYYYVLKHAKLDGPKVGDLTIVR